MRNHAAALAASALVLAGCTQQQLGEAEPQHSGPATTLDDRRGSTPSGGASPRTVASVSAAGAAPFGSPRFEPLPGARAEYGRLGETVFQIEIPKRWNGRLLMWMHGFQEFAAAPTVAPPDIRHYLIGRGYAWGASSFSSTGLIPGRAADETAALWAHFVRRHGRPAMTIVSGESMGGWAAHIAAARYGDRFDGALALCGAVGTEPALTISTDVLVAAAFVAGVTQTELDRAASLESLFEQRIRPALADPALHERFERILVALTGGPRVGARAGLHLEEETNLRRGLLIASTRLAPPRRRPWRLAPGAGVTSTEFARSAIRLPADSAAQRTYWAGTEVTGRLAMPLLTLHTTGDGQVPIDQAQLLRRRVATAGKASLLVQRVIRDANHCGFRGAELEAAFRALVRWIETGARPAGTNLADNDLRTLDRTFELGLPRPSAGNDTHGRVQLRGRATLDGRPFDARWIGAVIHDDGLVTPCQLALAPVRQGRFQLAIRTAETAVGCGRAGAEIILWTYTGRKLFATRPVPWPNRATTVTAVFASATPLGASPATSDYAGQAYRRNGTRHGPASLVEAFVDTSLCGHATVNETGYFILAVVGPDQRPGCTRDATVRFRVNGATATETAVNRAGENHLDLTTP